MFKYLAVLAFAISGITSGIMLIGNGISIFDKLIGLLLTLLGEPAKALTFTQIFKPCKSNTIKSFTILLWLFLLLASIFASTGYMLNMAKKNEQKSIVNSNQFKEIQTKQDNINQLIQTKQAEISTLQAEKQQTINNMTADKNNLPSDYKTAKADLQLKINATSDKYQASIDNKQNELTELNNQLNNMSISDVKPDAGNGYNNLFVVLANMLSSESEPIKPDTISFIFNFIVFGLMPELIANIFYYYYINSIDTKNDTTKNIIDEKLLKELLKQYKHYPDEVLNIDLQSSQQAPEADKNKVIGFKADAVKPIVKIHISNDFTDDELKIYTQYMNQNSNGNIAPGYKSISGQTGLKLETCRKIRGYLERLKKIETIANRTIILEKV